MAMAGAIRKPVVLDRALDRRRRGPSRNDETPRTAERLPQTAAANGDDQREHAAGDGRVDERDGDVRRADERAEGREHLTSPAPVAPNTWPGSINASPSANPTATHRA